MSFFSVIAPAKVMSIIGAALSGAGEEMQTPEPPKNGVLALCVLSTLGFGFGLYLLAVRIQKINAELKDERKVILAHREELDQLRKAQSAVGSN